jgi:hypothetical protein
VWWILRMVRREAALLADVVLMIGLAEGQEMSR